MSTENKNMNEKPRVLLLANFMIPYRLPIYRILADQNDFDFKVCFLNRKEGIRKWNLSEKELNFDYHFLPGTHLYFSSMDWGLHLNLGLLWLLIKYRPQVVVSTSWECPAHYFLVLYAKLFGFKKVLWVGTAKFRKLSRKPWVWKIKSWFIRQFDAYLSYGSAAADYLVEHGASRERIQIGYNTVDINFYIKESEERRAGENLQKLKALYPGKILLYVGRFIPVKGTDLLLEALARMKEKDWTGLIIGWGPEETRLKDQCERLKINDQVHFLDYVPAGELVDYYLLARALVLPSRVETWGLVVNEAMACETPVVVSDGCGCVPDMIENGVTGFSYPAEDTQQLSEILDRLIGEEPLGEQLSQSAKSRLGRYTPEHYADNLMKAMFK